MKYFIGMFIGLIVLVLLLFVVVGFYDSDVDVFQVEEKQVEEKPIEEKPIEKKKIVLPHKVVKKVLPKPLPKKEKASKKIPNDVRPYLQDDTLEVKENMTLVQVDKIWGAPDKVERTFRGSDKMMLWTYGNYWQSKSKLKGLVYYKTVKFRNGKLSYWTKRGDNDIRTHTRKNSFKNHLDQGEGLSVGMSKTEVYELWGLPFSFEVLVYNDQDITTRWHFEENNSLTHFVIFENNKVLRWGNY